MNGINAAPSINAGLHLQSPGVPPAYHQPPPPPPAPSALRPVPILPEGLSVEELQWALLDVQIEAQAPPNPQAQQGEPPAAAAALNRSLTTLKDLLKSTRGAALTDLANRLIGTGLVPVLLDAMKHPSCNPPAIRALHYVVYSSDIPDVCSVIPVGNAPAFILSLQTGEERATSASETAGKVIRVLCRSAPHRAALIDAGLLPALAALLHPKNLGTRNDYWNHMETLKSAIFSGDSEPIQAHLIPEELRMPAISWMEQLGRGPGLEMSSGQVIQMGLAVAGLKGMVWGPIWAAWASQQTSLLETVLMSAEQPAGRRLAAALALTALPPLGAGAGPRWCKRAPEIRQWMGQVKAASDHGPALSPRAEDARRAAAIVTRFLDASLAAQAAQAAPPPQAGPLGLQRQEPGGGDRAAAAVLQPIQQNAQRRGAPRRNAAGDADDPEVIVVVEDDTPVAKRARRREDAEKKALREKVAKMEAELEAAKAAAAVAAVAAAAGRAGLPGAAREDGAAAAAAAGPECAICMDSCKNPTTTDCGHVYCDACIREWLFDPGLKGRMKEAKKLCPTCKKATSLSGLRRIFV